MHTVALIPLRAGSKRIPGKNTKRIAGRPLCHWIIDAALESVVDQVVVSTDSKEIRSCVESLARVVCVIERPSELAQDDSSTERVIEHMLQKIKCDTVVTLQATSPLTTSEDIGGALMIYNLGYDSVVSVVPTEKRFYWYGAPAKPINYATWNRPMGHDGTPIFMENGAIYVTRTKKFDDGGFPDRLCGNTAIYPMPPYTSKELDEPEDWPIVEELLRKHKCQKSA